MPVEQVKFKVIRAHGGFAVGETRTGDPRALAHLVGRFIAPTAEAESMLAAKNADALQQVADRAAADAEAAANKAREREVVAGQAAEAAQAARKEADAIAKKADVKTENKKAPPVANKGDT